MLLPLTYADGKAFKIHYLNEQEVREQYFLTMFETFITDTNRYNRFVIKIFISGFYH